MSFNTITQTLSQPAVQIRCGECDIVFAVPKDWCDARANDHQRWYCPNGHPRRFAGETREQRLERELERQQERADAWMRSAEVARRQAAARKGQVTKLRKRIAAGECPCCRKPFHDLAAHMESEHPDFGQVPQDG